MRKATVAALIVADLHVRLKPTIARAGEPDWLAAQARPFRRLRRLQEKYNCPVLIAGDVFDRWDSPPELINWALKHLPSFHCYAIPGQHDLPYHRLDLVHRSAYGTLVHAGKIVDLSQPGISGGPGTVIIPEPVPMRVWGFPWGRPLEPCPSPHDLMLEVALVHDTIWTDANGFPGADPEKNFRQYRKRSGGYDLVITGDNHRSWGTETKREGSRYAPFYNCGGFQRLRADEAAHTPSIGVLYEDGSVLRHFLNVDGESLEIVKVEPGPEYDFGDFLQCLLDMGDAGLDYREAVKRALDAGVIKPEVREAVMRAMEDRK